MTTTGSRRPEDHRPEPLPEALAADLLALRSPAPPPTRDLWPAIAARLEPRVAAPQKLAARPDRPDAPAPPGGTAAVQRTRHVRHKRRNAGYAAAAAVVLAAGIGWQMWPRGGTSVPAPPPGTQVAGIGSDADAPLLHAADALAREYQGALREVQAAGGTATAGAGLDAELERSAAEVRAALARDPDALHLFRRLQRIYAHRLALNLRQA